MEDHTVGKEGSSLRRYSTSVSKFSDDLLVGVDNKLYSIKDRLTGYPSKLDVLSIVGMGGIGKTTLARKIYNDPLIAEYFDIQAVTILSQNYEIVDILLGLLQQFFLDDINKIDDLESSRDVGEQLWKRLKNRRYLVVIDDIWDAKAWEEMKIFFPNDCNGSRIILTTRNVDVAMYANPNYPPFELGLMDPKTSWELLSMKVFLGDNCPEELVPIGNAIALKCQGLPLAINMVAGHLSKVARTSLDWLNVEKQLPSFEEDVLDILALSYNCLPVHLRKCLLFAANEYTELSIIHGRKQSQSQMVRRQVGRELEKLLKKVLGRIRNQNEMVKIPSGTASSKELYNYKLLGVPTKKLMRFWIAAGYIDAESPRTLEDVAEDYLQELTSRNLVMVTKRGFSGRPERYIVHDLMIDMCRRFDDERIRRSGRYIEDFYNLASSMNGNIIKRWSKSAIDGENIGRSYRDNLKRNSALVKYENNSKWWLQMRLDALTGAQTDTYSHGLHPFALFGANEYVSDRLMQENFYVSMRGHLKHLEISTTCTIPLSVYKLHNLQTLINPHALPGEHLPSDVWMMSKLRHLHVGRITYLPSPRQSHKEDSGFPILESLQSVTLSSASCTQEIWEGIPNLRRLKLYEIGTECNVEEQPSLHCLNNLCFLPQLRSLKLSLQHPPRCLRHWNSPPPCLSKLTLKGTCFTKKDTRVLASLPNLEVLKLKYRKFEMNKWQLEHDDDIFHKLRFLLIKSLRLHLWEANSNNFPNLQHLVLRKCCFLKRIPLEMAEIYTLQVIELDRCFPAIEKSAREIQQEQCDMGNEDFKVHISW